jgi:hypothetical protein
VAEKRDIETITAEFLSLKRKGEESHIGMGKLLLEAKSQLKHGQWLEWLKNNATISISKAERLMRLANVFSDSTPVTNLDYSKAIVLARLPKEEIEGFIAESHEVNGETKNFSDLSRRDLEGLVSERTKSKSPNKSENQSDLTENQELDGTGENEAEKNYDPITKALGNMNFLNSTLDEILNNSAVEDKADEYEEFFNDLRKFCNEILERISNSS